MKYFLIFSTAVLIWLTGAALANEGGHPASRVQEVRLDFPDNFSRKTLSGPQNLVSTPLTGSPAASIPVDEGWSVLLADDFEAGFPGTTWTVFFEEGKPHWDVWSCTSGTSPHHSAGCAAGGEGAIDCGEEYPDLMNTFMTAGPVSIPDANISAGYVQCVLNLNSEIEVDEFFMLVSLDGEDDWNGFKYSGWYSSRTLTLDLANVPFLGNVLGEPELWVSFGFRSNDSVVDVNGAQVDDVVLAVEVGGVAEFPPSLQVAVLKNPGRTRTLQIMVLVTNGSGGLPMVTVGRTGVAMTSLGDAVYLGTYFASQEATEVTITASDTNSLGTGTAQATVSFE
jgi:hypothetical protein